MDEEFESESLDSLFERYMISGTTQEKEELAESYLDMFSEMCYDFACSKLTEDGVQELLPIVEKIEQLKDNVSWSLRAQAYEIMMEDGETRSDSGAVIHNGQLAIESSLKQLESGDEMRQLHYSKISFCYYTLIEYTPEDDNRYWKKSLLFIKASILENPTNANWTHYFRLMYSAPDEESILLTCSRTNEISIFREWCLSLTVEGSLSYAIASGFIRFREFMEYSDYENFEFPEEEYLFWLDRSLPDEIISSATHEVSGVGHLYCKEGVRLHRIDLLEKALHYFEKLYYEYSEAFAIYYATDVWEQLAIVYNENGLHVKADECITRALEWNADNEEFLQDNFSLLLHYAEFLERCYHYKGNIPRPDLEFVQSVSIKSEALGKGYYSGPYVLLANIALDKKDEHAAVALLAKALLLHELCIQEVIIKFYKNLPKGVFSYLENFIQNTLLFMKEISEGYCFNPKLKFEELEAMNDVQLIEAWILRKAELKRSKQKQ